MGAWYSSGAAFSSSARVRSCAHRTAEEEAQRQQTARLFARRRHRAPIETKAIAMHLNRIHKRN